MLSLAIYIVVFFAGISYAIHLLKQRQNSRPKPQRTESASDDSSLDGSSHR